MPTVSDYQKALKKLKEDRTKSLTELENLNKKIVKVTDKIADLKSGCSHSFEIFVSRELDDNVPITDKELSSGFPGILQRIKFDSEKLTFTYKGGDFDELMEFLNYYHFGLQCKTCKLTKILDLDNLENETAFVIRLKPESRKEKT